MQTKVVVLLALSIVSIFTTPCTAQNFLYSAFSNPYENSFAFSTPNLKQIFSTKLSSPQSINAQTSPQTFEQQAYNTQSLLPQTLLAYNALNYPQQYNGEAHNLNRFNSVPARRTPDEEQLRQQLALLQLLQQQQKDSVLSKISPNQVQPSANVRNTFTALHPQEQQQSHDSIRTQNLLGVAYSPSTKVSQVRFESGKLKYDF